MKKNNMFRIASVLLVAVLLSTCAISGAFAKYTTSSAAASDSARVAKFGITITGEATADLFAVSETNDGVLTVNSKADPQDNVVAPGTTGTLASGLTITEGDREVAVKVTPTATLTLAGWEADSNFYCPIVFEIGSVTIDGTDAKYTSSDILATDVQNAVIAALGGNADGTAKVYDADTEIYTGGTADLDFTWTWAFEGTDDGAAQGQTDDKDNALKAGTATIALSYSLSIEQVD